MCGWNGVNFLDSMAGDLPAAMVLQQGFLAAAAIDREGAARMEAAAARRLRRIADLA